jgi:hypothetical protein
MQVHDDRWIQYFRASGYTEVEPLATGMEGAVYRLGQGRVAKVWGGDKPHADLLILQRFYDELGRGTLPFATPEMLDVATVEGTSVTIERELLGQPLQKYLSEQDSNVPPLAEKCLGIVLEALATIGGIDSAHALPVLSEGQPFLGDSTWSSALVGLLERRVRAFGDHLRGAVSGFDEVYELIVESLMTMRVERSSVIHGDICGVNILVDDNLQPAALLDWGFLSTAGDPAFDASVAAGIFNMYGEHARAIDDRLLLFVADLLEVPLDHLLIYRAAYAVATSNAYDANGSDGHFTWCVNALRRSDVRDALHGRASR